MYFKSSRSKSTQRRSAQYEKTRRRKRIRQEERERKRHRREEQEQQEQPHQSTAAGRFAARSRQFRARFGRLGGAVHAAAWLVHNNVAHPMLGLVPCAATLRVHDVTSQWLNLVPHPVRSPAPEITSRRAWVLHNCVSHPLMGVLPSRAGFDWHDDTAERMDIDGWV